MAHWLSTGLPNRQAKAVSEFDSRCPLQSIENRKILVVKWDEYKEFIGSKERAGFAIARNVSLYSPYPRIKIGCAIVDKAGLPIGIGFNTSKTHPIQAQYDKKHRPWATKGCLHAEMSAIAYLLLPDIVHTCYVFREDLNNDMAMCRPCKSCMAALKDIKIQRLLYTTPTGIGIEDGFI